MQDRSDLGLVGCRKGGRQEMRDARKEGMHEKKDAGKEGCRKEGIKT